MSFDAQFHSAAISGCKFQFWGRNVVVALCKHHACVNEMIHTITRPFPPHCILKSAFRAYFFEFRFWSIQTDLNKWLHYLEWIHQKHYFILLSICKVYFEDYFSVSFKIVWATQLALSAHSKKVLRSNLLADWAVTLWSLHVHLMPAWVFSRCSGFLQLSKDMWVKLTGYSEFFIDVSESAFSSLW